MIRIDNLRKEYGDILAVNDLSLSIEAGRFFGLLGPNGAGKTTLEKKEVPGIFASSKYLFSDFIHSPLIKCLS